MTKNCVNDLTWLDLTWLDLACQLSVTSIEWMTCQLNIIKSIIIFSSFRICVLYLIWSTIYVLSSIKKIVTNKFWFVWPRYFFYVGYIDNLGRRLVDLWICFELLSSYYWSQTIDFCIVFTRLCVYMTEIDRNIRSYHMWYRWPFISGKTCHGIWKLLIWKILRDNSRLIPTIIIDCSFPRTPQCST